MPPRHCERAASAKAARRTSGGGGGKPRGRGRTRARSVVHFGVVVVWGNSSRGNLSCVWSERQRCRPAVARSLQGGRGWSSPQQYVMTMMTIIMKSDELFLKERAHTRCEEDSFMMVGRRGDRVGTIWLPFHLVKNRQCG